VAALAGNRLLLADGIPIATYIAGEVQFLTALRPPERWRARNALLRHTALPGLAQIG